MIRVWTAIDELTDGDFEANLAELDDSAAVTASARTRLRTRLFSFHHICFQLGICSTAPRLGQAPSLSAAQHAATIPQPVIAHQVVRYADTIITVLKASTVQIRIKSIRVLCDWLATEHPDVVRLDELDRSRRIEPFLAWAQTRPCRGNNGRGRTVSAVQFHHDVVDLRVFFEEIAAWGWASQPARPLFFLADLPRLPEPLPRALQPAVDRDLMGAVEHLDDDFARTAITVLRATGKGSEMVSWRTGVADEPAGEAEGAHWFSVRRVRVLYEAHGESSNRREGWDRRGVASSAPFIVRSRP